MTAARTIRTLVLLAGSLVAASPAAAALALPFDVPAPAAIPEPELCGEPVPAPVLSLAVSSRYDQTDASRSTLDEAADAAYQESMEPLRDFASAVTRHASRFVESGGTRADSAACVVDFLAAWARADALGDLATRQAVLSTTRVVAGLAVAWRIVMETPYGDPAERRLVGAWFARLADDIRPHYSLGGERRLSDRQNHRYWAGFAVAAAGVVTGRRDDLDWGVESFRIGACQIRPDGALPLELDRGKRARDYHLHATAPLVMIAELAAANGVDAYGICGGALHRLVDFNLAAVADPSALEAMTGTRQLALPTREGTVRGDRIAWLAPYLARFPEARARLRGLEVPDRLTSSNLGGNLSAYFGGE